MTTYRKPQYKLLIFFPPYWPPLPNLLHCFLLRSSILHMGVPKTQHLDLFVSYFIHSYAFQCNLVANDSQILHLNKSISNCSLAVSFVGLSISDIHDQSNSWFSILANKKKSSNEINNNLVSCWIKSGQRKTDVSTECLVAVDSNDWEQGFHGKDSTDGIITCCSVIKSCLTLCNPTDCSMPGSPFLYYHLEFTQIHVNWLSGAV